jgi:hypothetical protein
MPYKVNESRRHKQPDGLVWVTPEAIDAWTPPRSERRTRPQTYSDIAVEAGLMLRSACGRPGRQTEGLLSLDLSIPDHTTFSHRSADLSVAAALKQAKKALAIWNKQKYKLKFI